MTNTDSSKTSDHQEVALWPMGARVLFRQSPGDTEPLRGRVSGEVTGAGFVPVSYLTENLHESHASVHHSLIVEVVADDPGKGPGSIKRAEEITQALERAEAAMREARAALREAARNVQDDYATNLPSLLDLDASLTYPIQNALREAAQWRGFLDARRRMH